MKSIISEFKDTLPFPLDNFQIKAAEALIGRKSVLVTAPTGSGKTVVAEFAIFDGLDRNLKTVYTTPLKALSNQKFRDFSEQYGSQNVGLVTGDLSINPDASIVVMTTEILRNILYQDLSRLDEVLYVILDECHYMNDKDRGTVWEEIIIHAPKHVLFVALSATISNSDELSRWITSIHSKTVIIEHPHRPVPIEHLYYSKGKLTHLLNRDGSKIAKLAKKGDSPYQKREPVSPVSLIRELDKEDLLPAIYFVFSRRGCDGNLVNCLDARLNLTNKTEKARIIEMVKKVENENPSLEDTSPITKKLLRALPLGIAVHHAGLVPILRHLVEMLFQENLIKVVFATETLAAGINMPARTTVISSLSKRGDFGHEVLSVNSFTQMTGRAGRRGKDTVGYCVIIDDTREPYSEAARLVQSPPDPIKSNFTLSYNMVLNLLKNFKMADIQEVLKKSFGQYLSNKEIIDLRYDLENQQKNIEKYLTPCDYKPELSVNEMPLLEYENILDNIEFQEKNIRHLEEEFEDKHYKRMKEQLAQSRKGSVLVFENMEGVPILGSLVVTYSEKFSRTDTYPFFAIVLSNKGVTKITPYQCIYIYKDIKSVFLPDDIYAETYRLRVGAWITDKKLKKPFDKDENKRYMRSFPQKDYSNNLKNQIDKLDGLHLNLSRHECYNCPILDKHLSSHERFRSITREISELKETIEFRKELYINDFKKLMNVLLHYEQIHVNNDGDYKPTKQGIITSYLRAENELAISLMLNNGLLDNLDAVEISALLSTLVFEPRRANNISTDKFPKRLKTSLRDLANLVADLKFVQNLEGVEKEINVEPDIMELIIKWASGDSWGSLFDNNNLDDGDAIRSIRRIIDLLHQLKNIPDVSLELQQKFYQAIYLLDRDLITVNIEEQEDKKEPEVQVEAT